MQLFYKFVLASVIFASSVVANPADANADKQAEADLILCLNEGPLEHDFENCHVGQSLGMQSSVECGPGKYYYCFNQGGLCKLLKVKPPGLIGGDFIGGECFDAPY